MKHTDFYTVLQTVITEQEHIREPLLKFKKKNSNIVKFIEQSESFVTLKTILNKE